MTLRHHGGMRILVVEDEPLLADAVAVGLRHDAHAVDVVYDGAAALERAQVNDYDVLILDRDLPLVHGDEVCRQLAGRDRRPSAATRAVSSRSANGLGR